MMDLWIDEEKDFACIKLSGRLDSEIILKAFDQAVADERYRKGMGRLWDFREADLSALDTTTVISMAQHSMRYGPGINDVKVALVTGRDLEYGLSRVFEMTSTSNTPISVFRSIDDATKWIEKA